MAKVVWDGNAIADLNRTIAYIEQFNAGAADQMASRLFALGESLTDFPRRGRPVRDDLREMTTVPPYILRYVVQGDIVTIVSIHHGARNLD